MSVDDSAVRQGSKPAGGVAESAARYTWGLVAVAIGVGALVLSFLIVALLWRGSDGASALGIVASPIAAIVGAYFGIQVSTASAQRAQDRAERAENDKNDAVTDAHLLFTQLKDADQSRASRLEPHLRTFR